MHQLGFISCKHTCFAGHDDQLFWSDKAIPLVCTPARVCEGMSLLGRWSMGIETLLSESETCIIAFGSHDFMYARL